MPNKERRPSNGATNLNSSTSTKRKGSISSSSSTSGENPNGKNWFRSPSHKLISPGVYESVAHTEHLRQIAETAVWKENCRPYSRDFTTTSVTSYTDPRDLPPIGFHIKSMAEEQNEKAESSAKEESLAKMLAISKIGYGTTAGMLKSFKKDKGDELTMFEIKEFMKRAKKDNPKIEQISDVELRNIFANAQGNNMDQDSVSVTSFLKYAEDAEFKERPHDNHMMEMREFLQNSVALQREIIAQKNVLSDIDKLKMVKGVEDESKLMMLAVGSKAFDINVDHDVLDDALNHAYSGHTKHTLDSKEAQFTRHLRHGNINLKRIPFYDMRMNELDGSKNRAATLHQDLADPSMIPVLAELEKTRWNPSKSIITEPFCGAVPPERISLRQYQTQSFSSPQLTPHSLTSTRDSPLYRSAAASIRSHSSGGGGGGSVDGGGGGGDDTNSVSTITELNTHVSSSSSAASSFAENNSSGGRTGRSGRIAPFSPQQQQRSNSNTNKFSSSSGGGGGGGGGGSSSSSSSSNPLSPAKMKHLQNLIYGEGNEERSVKTSKAARNAANIAGTMFLRKDEVKVTGPTSFLLEQNNNSSSSNKNNNNNNNNNNSNNDSMEMNTSYDSDSSMTSAKTAKSHKTYSQIRIGHEMDAPSSHDRFTSMSRKFYPEIIYEPSRAPRRDLISDADVDHQARDACRKERHARKTANLDVTETRLKYEALDKEIRQMRRSETMIGERIRYQTAVILDDLRGYKQQPLERMAKKPNFYASDTMWGGQQDRFTAKVIPEVRDFATTYGASYPSHAAFLDSVALRDENAPKRDGHH